MCFFLLSETNRFGFILKGPMHLIIIDISSHLTSLMFSQSSSFQGISLVEHILGQHFFLELKTPYGTTAFHTGKLLLHQNCCSQRTN